MAARKSSFERFLASSSSEITDEETVKKMNSEINNLRIALKATKDYLLEEKQQKVKDRKVYEAKVKEMKSLYNDYFAKLSSEHDAKYKTLEDEYEINLKKLQCQSGCHCQQIALVHVIDKSVQSEASFVVSQSVQTEISTTRFSRGQQTDENNAAEFDALHQEVGQLKKKVAELVFMNNRYHIALSNCTLCDADDLSDASLTLHDPIRASTPLEQDNIEAELSPSTSVLSSTAEDRKREADTIKKCKDKTFITRMVGSLDKLEKKYQTPPHRRKPRLFKRKKMKCSIVPKEFSSIYEHLTSPGPDGTTSSPMLIPQVNWQNVKFKPVLPSPEECAVHSCAEDPDFYKEKTDCFHIRYNLFHKQNPFGSLLGYKTTLGTVPVPTEPIGGYVYCTEMRKWLLHATLPGAGRGLKGGGRGSPPSRRKNG